ncbi:MAG TPA: phosphate ABC transporter permease subunit PstC [Polyangia bacterium]|nr:phosphate ABC transporter permease subunit PstC [Polyangia bacterium]
MSPAAATTSRHAHTGDRAFAVGLTLLGGSVLFVVGVIVLVCARLSAPAFAKLGFFHFLAGTDWNPVEDSFGALPFVYGTLVTSAVAIVLAMPVAIGLALFLTEMSPARVRHVVSFFVEILAAIPSVVFGLWGLLVLVPILRDVVEPALGRWFGFVPLFSGAPLGIGFLPAGIVLAIMILPTIASVTIEVLRTMPAALREGALALGATRWEAIRAVVLPYARRGILGAVILGLGRALGETMAVTMLIGNQPEIHGSLFAAGYSLPAVIANEFAEASGAIHTGALAGLALVLFGVTLMLSAAARLLVRLSARRAVTT